MKTPIDGIAGVVVSLTQLTGFDKFALGFFLVAILMWAVSWFFPKLQLSRRPAPKRLTIVVFVVLGLLVLFIVSQ